MNMKCGERLVRCLTGGDIDRIPFGVGFGWCPWGETLKRWHLESSNPSLEPASVFGYDSSFAVPSLESGTFPHYEKKIIADEGETIVSLDWRGITMRNRKDGGSMPEFLDYPVKSPEDWERIKQERYSLDKMDERDKEDWPAFIIRLAETGEAVQVGIYPWGVFGTVRDLLGAEELLISFITEPEMVKDMMLHLTSLWIGLWERVAGRVQIDHIHIWEDMSGKQGSLISPAMVEEFMMPCYDRIVNFAKAHNVRLISVDTDGDCSELVPLMMKQGINMFFPFEVQAGCDILDYRKKYPALGIMGGLDKRALAGSIADVDIVIEKAAIMISKGRYVPMFDHLIPPDAKWGNFKYAADKIKILCESITR
jgi:hypothetical protein